MTLRVVQPPEPPRQKREAVCAFCESTFKVDLKPTQGNTRLYAGDCTSCGSHALFTYVAPEEVTRP